MRLTSFVLAISVSFGQGITAEVLIEAGGWKRARVLVERRLKEAPDEPNASFLASQIYHAFGDRRSPPRLVEKAVLLDGSVGR